MTAAQRNVHLVGSFPFETTREVFDLCATQLSGFLKRVPDGEPGIRKYWISWQSTEVLAKTAELEVGGQGVIPNSPHIPPFPIYRVKERFSPRDVKFPALGYAREAIASYRLFKEYQAAGKFDAKAKFQVSLPMPWAVCATYFIRELRRAMWPVYEAAMFAEVNAIAAAIPAHELAIQWDCVEPGMTENPDMMSIVSKEEFIAAIVRAVDQVPRNIEVGVHLCYGDPGGKHVVEPSDLSISVEFANQITARAKRPVTWFQVAVPIARDDAAYFAPLQDLKVGSETELVLGLLHLADGVDGAARRMASARRYLQNFAISTECGLGRRAKESIPDILSLHASAARLN